MLVQCFDRYDVIADFDTVTGLVAPRSRPTSVAVWDTDGWYASLDGASVVFYRHGGELKVRINSTIFHLDRSASIAWARHSGRSILQVQDASSVVVLSYAAGVPLGSLADDPTPFVEDEDWDLGLFMFNVLSDPQRAELVRLSQRGE